MSKDVHLEIEVNLLVETDNLLFLYTHSEKAKIQGVQNQTLQDYIYTSDRFI